MLYSILLSIPESKTINTPSQIQTHPLASIIIAAYNGEQYLAEQLASLENQTYPNIEFICCDNKSTDNTPFILEAWCDRSANRKLLTCHEKGLNKNFYYGIKHAAGQYIFFCDQDDIWINTKVEELIIFHETNAAASMVYCLSQPFTGSPPANINFVNRINRLQGQNIKQTMLTSFTLGHNICIKKEILDKIPEPENEAIAYDWWITVSAMCLGEIKCLTKALTYWRQHQLSTSDAMNKAGFFYETRLEILKQFLKNKLISGSDKGWIKKAIESFTELKEKKFSLRLFKFILANANAIFFYKTKRNILSKWVSFIKWSYRMSRQKHRP